MKHPRRFTFVSLGIYAAFLVIAGRLFYWQIIQSDSLQAEASDQYERITKVSGSRGQILTAEGHTLVGNEEVYRLFAEPRLLDKSPAEIAQALVETLDKELLVITASDSADLAQVKLAEIERVSKRLEEKKDSTWVGLYGKVSAEGKAKIEELELKGIGFEPFEVRFYPEASMAAHLTGFVGKTDDGEDIGYFGVEGALDKELQPRSSVQTWERGLLGFLPTSQQDQPTDGRDVYLTIRRDVQRLAEAHLRQGMLQYGAKSGEIVVLEPQTGNILASASFPNYDQKNFFKFDQEVFKNPIVTHVFEPGSTFKVITVAAGVEKGMINSETVCTNCAGPLKIDKYTIKTWNEEYHPNITISDALAKSDNVAMVFVQRMLSADYHEQIVRDFGIGTSTTQDLQEDTNTPFPQKWGPVERATISFGQGISTTTLQMVRAVAAIANQGKMMQPHIVSKVIDHTTGEEIVTQPQVVRQVISPETATQVTKMMVEAAEHGEAQWTASQQYTVAGKTGTAQIADKGSYDEEKTIASFIGFSPADNPKYVMMVKLVEPQSSIWASETAAPLWYDVAEQLNWMMGVTPDK